MCELERFGQKTNRGFYIYPEGSRAGQPDPEVVEIVEQTSAELGITRTEIDRSINYSYRQSVMQTGSCLKRKKAWMIKW